MSTANNIAAHPSIPADRDILVCIFQRGAADGLNAVVPYSDPDYLANRPTIAVPPPVDMDDPRYLTLQFALHPALQPLKPIYDAGDLALVLADLFRSPVPFFGLAGAALAAMDELQAADISSIPTDPEASYPDSPLGNKMKQAAQLIKSDLPVEVVCIDADGWDHHENLPTYIDLSLTELATTLSAF